MIYSDDLPYENLDKDVYDIINKCIFEKYFLKIKTFR